MGPNRRPRAARQFGEERVHSSGSRPGTQPFCRAQGSWLHEQGRQEIRGLLGKGVGRWGSRVAETRDSVTTVGELVTGQGQHLMGGCGEMWTRAWQNGAPRGHTTRGEAFLPGRVCGCGPNG